MPIIFVNNLPEICKTGNIFSGWD